MFEFIKKEKDKNGSPNENGGQYNKAAKEAETAIQQLESKLTTIPNDSELQKQLMLNYNRALKIYAKSRTHCQYIDELFVKIDNLRNQIRRNI